MTSPNQNNGLFSILQALQSDAFRNARQQSKLVVPMGMGINGTMEILDLGREASLLIAGSVTIDCGVVMP